MCGSFSRTQHLTEFGECREGETAMRDLEIMEMFLFEPQGKCSLHAELLTAGTIQHPGACWEAGEAPLERIETGSVTFCDVSFFK